VRNVIRRHHLPPTPKRGRSSWRTFLKPYRAQLLVCDFVTIETVTLQTVDVLFCIELGTCRVHLAGCTSAPDSATQQARQLVWEPSDTTQRMRFLIHDRDTKFSASFDQVFEAEGIAIVLTPFHAHKANAFAERWVCSFGRNASTTCSSSTNATCAASCANTSATYNTARLTRAWCSRLPGPRSSWRLDGRKYPMPCALGVGKTSG
jgi:putative transposase